MAFLDLYSDTYSDTYGIPEPAEITPPTPVGLRTLTREGAQVVARCEVWIDGRLAMEATAQPDDDGLGLETGEVTYDATAKVWRACRVTLTGSLPDTPSHPLAPVGSHLRLFRGAIDRDGTVAETPLGRFAFDETSVTRSDRAVTIVGYDYSKLVSEAAWPEPRTIVEGVNVATEIANAVRVSLPATLWQEPNLTDTSAYTAPATWGEESSNDPWQDVVGLAQQAGMLVYFDRRGRLTVVDVPDPDTGPLAEDLTVGDSPLVVDLTRTLDGRAPNRVVASSEDDPDVWAVAEDLDPDSPSYVGRYRRTVHIVSPIIRTSGDAWWVASAHLRTLAGLGEVVSMTTVPAPWLDVWDVVVAHDPETHTDVRAVVDSMTVPLRPGEGSLVTRRRRL